MSGILYREFKDGRYRTVAFLTILPPKDWRWIVSRFLETEGNNKRRATDIDLSRDSSTGITCHEMTLTLPMDAKKPDQLLGMIFGNDFLNKYLPITDKSKMGTTGGVFLRMGSLANPKGPPSENEIYAFFRILMSRGSERKNRHAECVKDFDQNDVAEQIGSGIVADVDAVRTLVKKHRIEGGSWLLYPMDRTKDQQLISPDDKTNLCKRAFDKIVRAFLEGSLLESDVTRVTYTPIKGVIKVFNPNSEYFEVSARNPRPDLNEIFAADIQVNQAYMKLSQLGLSSMRMRYKPEIFTVWNLHSNVAQGAVLTLYQDLPHAVKMEIAKKCVSPSPPPPEAPPSGDTTPTPSSSASTPTPDSSLS